MNALYFLRLPQVVALCGISRTEIYRRSRDTDPKRNPFPPSRKYRANRQGAFWLSCDVTAWQLAEIGVAAPPYPNWPSARLGADSCSIDGAITPPPSPPPSPPPAKVKTPRAPPKPRAEATRPARRRKSDQLEPALSLDEAKLRLQRRGRVVYNARIRGGREDRWYVSGLGLDVTDAQLVAEASKAVPIRTPDWIG